VADHSTMAAVMKLQ